MNIFDFITQEEIDDLPDNDPQAAFITFVRIAQRRLGDHVRELDNTEESWRAINEAQQSFMNVAVAAAKKFGIEPFATMEVPRLKDFSSDDNRQFRADLDHYMTQLVLDASSRARRDSVFITPDLKSTIRTYVHHLRELIEKSNDVSSEKREVLLRRLAEFEGELEKKRLNLVSVSILIIAFASAPGGIGASIEMANKLISNITRAVGDAKAADEATRRLPSAEQPFAISGPRTNDLKPARQSRRDDMDDEIPF
ncbi:MAG TPA: hypothetical protein VK522_04410 [Pseudolabrys sp.]|nr:hypothetical protein [Pseudolabrys sp.]